MPRRECHFCAECTGAADCPFRFLVIECIGSDGLEAGGIDVCVGIGFDVGEPKGETAANGIAFAISQFDDASTVDHAGAEVDAVIARCADDLDKDGLIGVGARSGFDLIVADGLFIDSGSAVCGAHGTLFSCFVQAACVVDVAKDFSCGFGGLDSLKRGRCGSVRSIQYADDKIFCTGCCQAADVGGGT